jgi:hypothetical protein
MVDHFPLNTIAPASGEVVPDATLISVDCPHRSRQAGREPARKYSSDTSVSAATPSYNLVIPERSLSDDRPQSSFWV